MNKMSDICDVLNYNKNGLDIFYFDKLYVTYDLIGYKAMPICAIDRNQTMEEIIKHVLKAIEEFDIWSMPIETFDLWLNELKEELEEGYHEGLEGYEPNTIEWYRRNNEQLYEILEEMEYKLKFEYLEHLEGQWK